MMIYKTVAKGVEQIHRSYCPFALGTFGTSQIGCACPPKYRARQPGGGRKTFDSLEAAIDSTKAPSWITVAGAISPFTIATDAGIVELRASVAKQYLSALRHNVVPHIGDVRLDRLNRATLTQLADTLVQQGVSASTVRNAFIALRALHRWAWERGFTEHETLPSVRLPNGDRDVRSRSMLPAEAAQRINILAHDGEYRASVVYALALWAGLRRGEIAALRWCDIDFEQRVIRVKRSYSYSTGTEGPPKSKAGLRRVPIPPKLAGMLRNWKRPTDIVAANNAVIGHFHSGHLQARANAAWKRAELEPLGLHEARHCYASMLIAAGMNIKQVSTYMGHASVNITLDRYAHLMPDDTETAINQLSAAGF